METATQPQAATQLTDSLSYIDQQVAQVLQISIPPNVSVGNLQLDVQSTKQEALYWQQSLRGAIVTVLQQVITLNTDFAALAKSVNTLPQDQLVALVQKFQQQTGELATNVGGVGGLIGHFRACMAANSSALSSDLQLVQQQIQAQQQQMQQLQQQIQAQQEKIDYYRNNPFLLVLLGLTIVGLIVVLQQMQSEEQSINDEMRQIAETQQALQPLMESTGPINSMITGIGTLDQGVVSLNTAVSEAKNTLDQLTDLTVARAIIAADVATVAQGLAEAAQIADEVLGLPS